MFLGVYHQSYHLSLKEIGLSLATGLSGLPYSRRHWALASMKSCELITLPFGFERKVWMHRTLAIIEALPVIGGLTALIERITFLIKDFFYSKRWKPQTLPLDQAIESMRKNSQKAINEHIRKSPSEPYATVHEALPTIEKMNEVKLTQLQFRYSVAEMQGRRSTMEDAHFYKETQQGVLTGVLDGHRGIVIAQYVSDQIQNRFFDSLIKNHGNVRQTFEFLFNEIQQDIVHNSHWDPVGSTAVICYIDKRTHLIYTATLGDSEANIYRTIDQQVKSISLSCVRDWSSTRDALRAAIANNDPQIAEDWPKEKFPKFLRHGNLNVSRAFGDVDLAGTMEKPGVIHKPKITINQLNKGDTLILACDGLKDYASEKEIITFLGKQTTTDQVKDLANWVITKKFSSDNVTIVAVNVS